MPVTTLKTVVFPAPFGPITLNISPSCTWKSTASTARKPPNCMDSPTTSSRAMSPTSGRDRLTPVQRFAARPTTGQPNLQPSVFGTGAQQSVGPQDHDQDEECTVKHHAVFSDSRCGRPEHLG